MRLLLATLYEAPRHRIGPSLFQLVKILLKILAWGKSWRCHIETSWPFHACVSVTVLAGQFLVFEAKVGGVCSNPPVGSNPQLSTERTTFLTELSARLSIFGNAQNPAL